MYNTLKENNILKKTEFNSKCMAFIMTCWDNLLMELREFVGSDIRLSQ
jgi:hypothetical protein